MKPKEILALSEEELFLKLKENVERKVLQKYSILTEELKKQIEFELVEIRKTGLGREILILEDLVEYADKTNIPVGFVRGDALPCIVIYILGITKIDPIHWGLIPEQIFQSDYGKDILSIWINFGNFRLIRKYLNKNYYEQIQLEAARIAKEVKFIKVGINLNPNLNLYYFREVDIIAEAVKIISRKEGRYFDLKKISLEDKNTYALYQDGKVENIILFQSNGMRESLHRLKPETFTHLYTLHSLYRPSQINSGILDKYIQNRLNLNEIEKIHSVFDKHTKETYGILVFQEQVTEIIHGLIGISLYDASLFVKIFKSKNPDKLEEIKYTFLKLGNENGILGKDLISIWEVLEKQAENTYSKSQAISHCLISYQMAFIKAHYPIEFTTAIWKVENHKEIVKKRYEKMKARH